MKKIKILRTIGIFAVFCMLIFSSVSCSKKPEETSIGNLAYDVDKRSGYTVYLKENGEYEPYFVLTNNYYGNTLLLRKFVTGDIIQFNIYEHNGACNSYYPDSLMDKFLSEDFYNRLDENIQEKIVETEVEITTKKSIEPGPVQETERISRKIFLLSAYELGKPPSGIQAKEGLKLKCFEERDSDKILIGYEKEGETITYWTRTPETWDDYAIYVVSWSEGMFGIAQVNYELAVRPIFCVKNDEIVKLKEIDEYGEVYVLE